MTLRHGVTRLPSGKWVCDAAGCLFKAETQREALKHVTAHQDTQAGPKAVAGAIELVRATAKFRAETGITAEEAAKAGHAIAELSRGNLQVEGQR